MDFVADALSAARSSEPWRSLTTYAGVSGDRGWAIAHRQRCRAGASMQNLPSNSSLHSCKVGWQEWTPKVKPSPPVTNNPIGPGASDGRVRSSAVPQSAPSGDSSNRSHAGSGADWVHQRAISHNASLTTSVRGLAQARRGDTDRPGNPLLGTTRSPVTGRDVGQSAKPDRGGDRCSGNVLAQAMVCLPAASARHRGAR